MLNKAADQRVATLEVLTWYQSEPNNPTASSRKTAKRSKRAMRDLPVKNYD